MAMTMALRVTSATAAAFVVTAAAAVAALGFAAWLLGGSGCTAGAGKVGKEMWYMAALGRKYKYMTAMKQKYATWQQWEGNMGL